MVGSTEVDQLAAIKTTFSSCFAAPFLLRSTEIYVELFRKRLAISGAQVYLVNTGWIGGSYRQGHRFPLAVTRAIIDAILNGYLKTTEYNLLPWFQLAIPNDVPDVDPMLLDPRNSWGNSVLYNEKAKGLITLFLENAKRFQLSEAILAAGPTLI